MYNPCLNTIQTITLYFPLRLPFLALGIITWQGSAIIATGNLVFKAITITLVTPHVFIVLSTLHLSSFMSARDCAGFCMSFLTGQ